MPAPSTSAAAASEATEQRYERWGSEAEVRFEQAFGQPWHGPLRDREPLVKALRRLERSAQELAELNGWPAQEDRALGYLASLIDGTAEYRRHAGGRPPRHLGWFVPGVLAEARRCERKLRARRPEREARARRQAAAEARAYVEQVLRDRAMAEPGPPVEPGKRTLTGVPS